MEATGFGTGTELIGNEFRNNCEQFLTFILNDEEYGIDILKVQGIQGLGKVTALPHTPEFILGVVNLRGAIVPIINLRSRFGMELIPDGPTTVVIVVKVQSEKSERIVGLLVDAVSEVHDIARDDLKPAPDFGSSVNSSFISALATVDERMLILLDIDHLINTGVMASVDQVLEQH
jgi:purine-binding chemotaxis protein CheW